VILMDTHVWWWALNEPNRLSEKARSLIQKTPPAHRGISAISIWEFAMMACRGRIELSVSPKSWLDQALARTGIRVIHLNPEIALESCILPGKFHKDPCDRMIVATARFSNCVLITADEKILSYPSVNSVW
jgi:PIN domain nuclease of toxin-antitoxin system